MSASSVAFDAAFPVLSWYATSLADPTYERPLRGSKQPLGMTEAGDGVEPEAHGGCVLTLEVLVRSWSLVVREDSSTLRSGGSTWSPDGGARRAATRGEGGCAAAVVIERSMSSHSAPMFVPLAALTARAGILLPRIAFISGSGHGETSVMLHTMSIGTEVPPWATAVPRQRVAYARIVSGRLAVHTMIACLRVALPLRKPAGEVDGAETSTVEAGGLLLLRLRGEISRKLMGTCSRSADIKLDLPTPESPRKMT